MSQIVMIYDAKRLLLVMLNTPQTEYIYKNMSSYCEIFVVELHTMQSL